MSTNTQSQGRSYESEKDFTYVPVSSDTPQRELNRWILQYDRALNVGDVTKDAAAKQAAMLYGPVMAHGTAAPTLSLTQGTAATVTLSTISSGTPASVSATAGSVPAGMALAVSGQTVTLAGTPSAAGAVSFTATVVTDHGSVDVAVTGSVAASAPAPAPSPAPGP